VTSGLSTVVQTKDNPRHWVNRIISPQRHVDSPARLCGAEEGKSKKERRSKRGGPTALFSHDDETRRGDECKDKDGAGLLDFSESMQK